MLALINVLVAVVLGRAEVAMFGSAVRLSTIVLTPSAAKAVGLVLLLQHALTQPERRPTVVIAALLLAAAGALALRLAHVGPSAPLARQTLAPCNRIPAARHPVTSTSAATPASSSSSRK